MTAAGLIFSNIHDDSLSELTRIRTMASVPFGGRYRLIDFTLSNMANAGIVKVGISTSNNYRSLVDHLGSGKDWDLARRSAGIKILPPNISSYSGSVANGAAATRLGAMLSAINFIERCDEDVLVLSDCDTVCNIDLGDVIASHVERNADITVVTKYYSEGVSISEKNSVITSDEDGRITDVRAFSGAILQSGDISTNIMVVSREYLLRRLYDARSRGFTSFYRDILARCCAADRCYIYKFNGFYSFVNSIQSYYRLSMALLEPDVRAELFNAQNRPVYTKVRNSAPTVHREGAKVTNSLLADGCVIEGTVENCIIFRGVRIGKGSVVKNSILMQDTYIGDNITLNCVITDKNVAVRSETVLSGHETMPFFIGKGIML